MSAEYSVDKLNVMADRLDKLSTAAAECRWSEFSMRIPAEPTRDADLVMASAAIELRAYAERIKADEVAVPVAEVIAGYNLNWLGPDYGCSLAVGTKLYTHQSAQAAQVDAWKLPPCGECGAKTAAEAETMCICSGDKDECHGTSIWPDNAPTAEPVAQGTHNAMWGKCKHGVDEDDLCHECANTAEPVARPSPDAADGGLVGNSDIERIANLHGVRSFSVDGKTGMSHVGWRFTASQLCSAIEAALAAQPQSAASPAGVPDGDDMAQLKRAVEDWNDDVDTDVPQSTLMRLTELGLLVAEQFEVTKKGMDLLAAAQPAQSVDVEKGNG